MDIHSKHIKLYQGSIITLKALEHFLTEANISSIIKNNSNSARLAGFGDRQNDNDLFIFEEDSVPAQKILQDFLSKKD